MIPNTSKATIKVDLEIIKPDSIIKGQDAACPVDVDPATLAVVGGLGGFPDTVLDIASQAISNTLDTEVGSVDQANLKVRATVLFTGNIDVPGATGITITFKLFRDGAEINANDQFKQFVPATSAATVSLHWVDSTATAGPHTYDVMAIASTSGATALARRMTVLV